MTATEVEERIKAMAAVGGRPSHVEIKQPKWERTPRWMFWMPYWRRLDPNAWRTDRYEYRTKRELAHEFLREKFDDNADTNPGTKPHGKPFNSSAWTGRR